MFIIRWFLNAVIIYAIASLLPGVSVVNFYTALIVVIIFGLVNAVLGRILKLLTLPINIVTLGILGLVINGLMFWLTSSIVKGFEVSSFWTAFVAALIYSILTAIIGRIVRKS